MVLGRGKEGDEQQEGFVMLGSEKTCSRKAATIDFAEDTQDFVIHVMGKNGILLNRKKIEKGQTRSLGRRSSLKIGPYKIYFLLAVKNEIDANVLSNDSTTPVSLMGDESRASVPGKRARRFTDYKERLIQCFQTKFKGGTPSTADLAKSLKEIYVEDFADREVKSLKRTISKVLQRHEESFLPVSGSLNGREVVHYKFVGGKVSDSNESEAPETKKRRVALTQVS